MIPIMAIGNEYKKYESRISTKRIPLSLMGVILLLFCLKGEIELSKGIIYGKLVFYTITLLGILFCVKLKDYIMKNQPCSDFISWIGRNSMYIMGYHFIVFKLIDIVENFCVNTTNIAQDTLKLFPYSFPQCRVLYISLGVLLPCIGHYMLAKGKDYIKHINKKS